MSVFYYFTMLTNPHLIELLVPTIQRYLKNQIPDTLNISHCKTSQPTPNFSRLYIIQYTTSTLVYLTSISLKTLYTYIRRARASYLTKHRRRSIDRKSLVSQKHTRVCIYSCSRCPRDFSHMQRDADGVT